MQETPTRRLGGRNELLSHKRRGRGGFVSVLGFVNATGFVNVTGFITATGFGGAACEGRLAHRAVHHRPLRGQRSLLQPTRELEAHLGMEEIEWRRRGRVSCRRRRIGGGLVGGGHNANERLCSHPQRIERLGGLSRRAQQQNGLIPATERRSGIQRAARGNPCNEP